MSRIGKKPIPIPDKVQVTIDGSEVTVKGPKGELNHSFPAEIDHHAGRRAGRDHPSDRRAPSPRAARHDPRADRQHGDGREHRVSSAALMIEGVGYRAEMDGKNLVMYLGYSHPIPIEPPEDVEFAVEERGRVVTRPGDR